VKQPEKENNEKYRKKGIETALFSCGKKHKKYKIAEKNY
jgi:hypothetical protein